MRQSRSTARVVTSGSQGADGRVRVPHLRCGLRCLSQPTLWGHASRVPGRGWRGVAPLPLRTPSFPRRCRGSGRAAGAAPRNPPPVRRWLTHRTAMVAARATSAELASGRAKAVAIDSRMIEMAAILLFTGMGRSPPTCKRPRAISPTLDCRRPHRSCGVPVTVSQLKARLRVTSMSRRTARSRPSVWAEAGEAPTDRQPGLRRLA